VLALVPKCDPVTGTGMEVYACNCRWGGIVMLVLVLQQVVWPGLCKPLARVTCSMQAVVAGTVRLGGLPPVLLAPLPTQTVSQAVVGMGVKQLVNLAEGQ